MKLQLPPSFHTQAVLSCERLIRQCYILRGHPDVHPSGDETVLCGSPLPLAEDLRAQCPRPTSLPFTQYILPREMSGPLDVYRLAGYRGTGIVGFPHLDKYRLDVADIEPPTSFTCPYHRTFRQPIPVTSHGLWGAFRPAGQPDVIPRQDQPKPHAQKRTPLTPGSIKWHKRRNKEKSGNNGSKRNNGPRRAPSRRCTQRPGSSQYPGASSTGHPRLGEDYQVQIPSSWPHTNGR